MVIPNIIFALGTVNKDLEIREGTETIQTIALFRSVRMLRCVLET